MSELTVGQPICWHYKIGDWSFCQRVVARVLKLTDKRVSIRVYSEDLEKWVTKSVKPQSLSAMTPDLMKVLTDTEQESPDPFFQGSQ